MALTNSEIRLELLKLTAVGGRSTAQAIAEAKVLEEYVLQPQPTVTAQSEKRPTLGVPRR